MFFTWVKLQKLLGNLLKERNYFLKRNESLVKYTYNILRLDNPDLASELYFQLQEKESDFASNEFVEVAPLNYEIDDITQKDLSSIPISDVDFPKVVFMIVGNKIEQVVSGGTAVGYVASWDKETKVLKYIQDRSLYFDPANAAVVDQTDYNDVDSKGKVLEFEATSANVISSGFAAAIDTNFNAGITTVGTKNVDLGVTFTNGLAKSEINKGSGTILYIDNRATIKRNSRQKEDIKIILEF